MSDLKSRNKKTMTVALCFVAGMVVLSFASVPLYRKICQVTGWGGTTQEVAVNPFKGQEFAQDFTVRFNTDTDPGLPWDFRPEMVSVDVKAGQDGFMSYKVKNLSAKPVTGTAVYNVTPLEAGKYFYKTQCFCFGEQTLQPGEEVNMPITFFIDPKITDNRDLRNLKTVTLSYTFYKKDTAALTAAIENFTDTKDTP